MLQHQLHKIRHARLSTRALACAGALAALGVSAILALAPFDAQSLSTARASAQRLVPAAASTSSTIAPSTSCAALATDDFTDIPVGSAHPDAITQVSSAAVAQYNGAPYCVVNGYISPQTQFQIDLPVSTWQGDYLQEGCGGRCSVIPFGTPAVSSGCVQVSGNNLVLAADDAGHTGLGSLDSAWAANNADLRAVFGISSEHSLADAAKAIIAAYYGVGPTDSYFDGCSQGGKQAMTEAELYPHDFQGIIAGSPTIFYGQLNAEEHGWQIAVNTNAQGQDILTPAKLPALHAAVMAACATDGVIGGATGPTVGDPRTCNFNPASIECPAGVDDNSCLTPAQVTVATDFYTGPVLPNNGGNLYPGGVPYGSELAWTSLIAPAGEPTIDSSAGQQALGYLKYMGYPTDPASPYTMADFQFNRADFDALEQEEKTYNATDPDLSAFRAAGGKLIMYDGWAASTNSPLGTVAYYEAMASYMGGYQASQSFSRDYMVPGAGHCLGEGAGYLNVSPDFLTAIINWVQNGQAPGSMTLPVSGAASSPAPASITINPFNPFTPVTPPTGGPGLNNNIHYIGAIAHGVDTGSLASIPPGQP